MYGLSLQAARQRTFAVFREVQRNEVSLDIISQVREAIFNGTLNPGIGCRLRRSLSTISA